MRPVRECHDCGLVQCVREPPPGCLVRCARCDAILHRAASGSAAHVLASALSGGLLLFFAHELPVIDLRIAGRFGSATALDGSGALASRGYWELSLVIVATLLVVPALRLGITAFVASGVLSGRRSGVHPLLLRAVTWLEPWAMTEVFLVAVLVAYGRLRSQATADLGIALMAFAGVKLASFGFPGLLAEDSDDARAAGGAGRPRKKNSIARTWALVLGALLLYVPANTLPMLSWERTWRGESDTILGGVVDLFDAGLWPLALIVLLASIFVPLVKLVGLAIMLVATQRRSGAYLRGRTKLYRFIDAIGRWSMIDVFVLGTLTAVVRMGHLATVRPGPAAIAFAGVVVLTMIATSAFDPRLMWDAAEVRG